MDIVVYVDFRWLVVNLHWNATIRKTRLSQCQLSLPWIIFPFSKSTPVMRITVLNPSKCAHSCSPIRFVLRRHKLTFATNFQNFRTSNYYFIQNGSPADDLRTLYFSPRFTSRNSIHSLSIKPSLESISISELPANIRQKSNHSQDLPFHNFRTSSICSVFLHVCSMMHSVLKWSVLPSGCMKS